MHERPIGDLVDALANSAATIDYLGNAGLPAASRSPRSRRRARDDTPIRVRGDVSSQFLTALLMALPLAGETRRSSIEVVGELISKPYIEITLNLLRALRHRGAARGWQRFTIPAAANTARRATINVEADASSASVLHRAGRDRGEAAPVRIEGVGARLDPGRHPLRRGRAAMGAHRQRTELA